MAFTASDLAAVERALASGARSVTVAGKSISYASVAELEQLRRRITAELNAGTSAAHVQPRHQLADFSDG